MENLPSRKPQVVLLNPQHKAIQQWHARFPTVTDFKHSFSPETWECVIGNPSLAYVHYSPTLATVNGLYGDGVSALWIEQQVLAVWFMTTATDPTIANQAKMWSRLFASQNKCHTVGELRIFFARCATGQYYLGNQFDVTKLGAAWEKFKIHWRDECGEYEYARAQYEKQMHVEHMKKHGLTYEEWCKLEGRDIKEHPLPLSIGNADESSRSSKSAKLINTKPAENHLNDFEEKRRKFFEGYTKNN